MKDMSLKYIVRESNLSIPEKLMISEFSENYSNYKANLKLEAFAIYTKILMAMADNKESGFFIEAGQKELKLLANEILYGVDIDLIKEVIDSCVENGLFDKDYYLNHKILTSRDIQEKYFYSPNVKRRNNEFIRHYKKYIYPDIWKQLLEFKNSLKIACKNNEIACKNEEIACKNKEIACKNDEIACKNRQTKLNKTKLNKTEQNKTESETKIDDAKNYSSQNSNSPPKEIILSENQKLSLSKFFENFPNKTCKIDFEIPENIDFKILTEKINQSGFLKTLGNLDLKWCVQNYKEILSDQYKDFEKNKNEHNYSMRKYDFDLNTLFDNLEEIEI